MPYQESVANFGGKARLILIEGSSHRFEHLGAATAEIRPLLELRRADPWPYPDLA